MLRRTVRTLRLLGVDTPAVSELTALACGVLSPSFPALAESASRKEGDASQEDEAFSATLRTGSTLFERITGDIKSGGGTTVPGEQAFLLHDTHGFPIDLVLEMAREEGLSVDEAGFRRLMDEQRQRAKRDTAERKSGLVDASVYST